MKCFITLYSIRLLEIDDARNTVCTTIGLFHMLTATVSTAMHTHSL